MDPITGKMYLGERRNPGMEMWTDPDTGITYVRTADGKLHNQSTKEGSVILVEPFCTCPPNQFRLLTEGDVSDLIIS